MPKRSLALAGADQDSSHCAFCGRRRDGIEVAHALVPFICTHCLSSLGRWLPTVSVELAENVWTFRWRSTGSHPSGEVENAVTEIAAVLSEESRSLGETVFKPEDADVRLDLGIAYREMGLGRDAILEWATVLRAPANLRATRRAIQLIFDLQYLNPDGFELLRSSLYPT